MSVHRSRTWLRVLCTSCLALALAAVFGPATADPVFGFREDWPGTSIQGWGGGGASGVVLSNPGTGGSLGVGDGYLRVSLSDPGPFGTRSTGPEYAGNWLLAGIEQVRVSVNDVGALDSLRIHFCVGNTTNFWQHNGGIIPTNGVWREYAINLLFSSEFTRIIGSGTFEDALASTDRILFRSDLPPYIQSPDPAHGDFGIDGLVLTAVATPARRMTWGRIKALYR